MTAEVSSGARLVRERARMQQPDPQSPRALRVARLIDELEARVQRVGELCAGRQAAPVERVELEVEPDHQDEESEEGEMAFTPKKITWKGEERTAREWSERLGISISTVYGRSNRGEALDGSDTESADKAIATGKRAKAPKARRVPPPVEAEPPVRSDLDPVDVLRRVGFELDATGEALVRGAVSR